MPCHGFEDASRQLLHVARGRIRAGVTSERRLARFAGVSQPHLHNILAGKRGLANNVADKLAQALGLSFRDLLEGEEPAGAAVAWFEGPLGGGRAFPRMILSPPARFFDSATLRELEEPCLGHAAPEESAMAPTLLPEDNLLLECAGRARRRPRRASIYAIEWEGLSYLCRCAATETALLTLVESSSPSLLPKKIPLAGRRIEDIVRGEVVWFGRGLGRRP